MDVLVGFVEQFSQFIGLALGDEGGPLLDAGGSGRLADLSGGGCDENEGESEGREDGTKEVVAHQEILGVGRGKGERKGQKKGDPKGVALLKLRGELVIFYRRRLCLGRNFRHRTCFLIYSRRHLFRHHHPLPLHRYHLRYPVNPHPHFHLHPRSRFLPRLNHQNPPCFQEAPPLPLQINDVYWICFYFQNLSHGYF